VKKFIVISISLFFGITSMLKAQSSSEYVLTSEKYKNPVNSMDKIFEIAKSVNANTIQQMKYDGTDVYLIINTFYYIDGKAAFKAVSTDKKTYEPPIDKNKLKMALGKWIKNKNGNYTALK